MSGEAGAGPFSAEQSAIEVDVEAEPEARYLPDHAFHKLYVARSRVRLAGEDWAEPRDWEIIERRDSVALLLHVRRPPPDSDTVVLTRQFRAPLLRRPDRERSDYEQGAIMLEAIAGVVPEGETAGAALARETREEVGYHLEPGPDGEFGLEKIATFFPSPGGLSEQITIYYAATTSDRRLSAGGGDRAAGELIEPIEMPVDAFFSLVETGKIHDAKILVAFTRFRDRVLQRRAQDDGRARFTLKDHSGADGDAPPLRLHLRRGDIRALKGVDVWVNSENTLLEMDQLVGRSVSSAIRTGGAWIEPGNLVRSDPIYDALRRETQWRGPLSVGEVIETPAYRLGATNGVRRIFHVASVVGDIGRSPQTEEASIPLCVTAALAAIEKRNARRLPLISRPYRSVALPLIGSGRGGLAAEKSIRGVLRGVQAFASSHRAPALNDIYIAIFTDRDFDQAEKILSQLDSGFSRGS
ncbi:MAG: NUDIX domain-containing protein [Pseudomonadota bacterium]